VQGSVVVGVIVGAGVGVVADTLTGVDAAGVVGAEVTGRGVSFRRLHPAMLTPIRTATVHAMEVLSVP